MWEHYSSDAPWDPAKWEIKSKVGKDLAAHPFDNVMRNYSDWAANMTNHLIACNQGYGKILYFLHKEKAPLTYEKLHFATRYSTFPGLNVDLVWVARAMWTFIYEHVTSTTKRGLNKKVGPAETLNGLERWRRMYFDNQGGAIEVEIQDRDCFINFPMCKDPKHLNEYLNTWEELSAVHGAHLPDDHLQGC